MTFFGISWEMDSESTTLLLLGLSLLFVFAHCAVQTRVHVPRAAGMLIVAMPWGISLLAGALCPDASIYNACTELKLLGSNSTEEPLGYFDTDGDECVYEERIPALCRPYFKDVKRCPNAEARRQLSAVQPTALNTCFHGQLMTSLNQKCTCPAHLPFSAFNTNRLPGRVYTTGCTINREESCTFDFWFIRWCQESTTRAARHPNEKNYFQVDCQRPLVIDVEGSNKLQCIDRAR
jgi:hypothetical protein